jgi:exonuclease SbcC
MIFKKLELKNFKSHLNTTITFNRGISLIIGENGAGKSSIFEAISFALFKDSNVKLVDLVRSNKGVNDRIEMGVKLTFNSNGVDYRVERSVVKNNDTAKSAMEKLIKITDVREETVASKTTEVNREIEQILSMDSSTFLNAIHIKQGQISELFDKTAAERKELIGQLLKLDDLENAFKRIPEITKEKISDRDYLSGKIINETELNNDLRDVQKEQKNTYGKR